MEEREESVVGAKLSQAAPVLPSKTKEPKMCYGVTPPVSAATIPSVYNKKLNKLFRGRLVVLPGDFTVGEALRRMSRFNISSVPVTQSRKDSTILGFVDMLDLLAFMCSLIRKELKPGETIQLAEDEKENLRNKTEAFRNTLIREIVNLSQRDPFYILHGEESLSDAVELYLKGSHRIAITDDDGDIIGVISQWTIANYLSTVPTDDKEWIPTLREPVGQSRFTTDNVISIDKNRKTIEAFMEMHSNKLSSLAVVDDNGKLWGNLSASDLKGFQLFFDNFEDLFRPVSEFLSTIRKMQGRPENFVVCVKNDTPVKDIVSRFNEDIIHRVYVVDNEGKPTGVFSLTNLMRGLIVDTHTISTFAKSTAIPSNK